MAESGEKDRENPERKRRAPQREGARGEASGGRGQGDRQYQSGANCQGSICAMIDGSLGFSVSLSRRRNV